MINGAYRFNPTTQGFTLPKLGNLQKQAGWDDIKNFLRPAVDAASAWPVVGGLVKPLAQIAAAPVNAAQQLYHQGKDLVHGVKAVQAINATPGGKEVLQQAAANPQKTVEMAQDAQKTQAWAKENPQLAHWFQTYRDKGFGGALSEGWDDITKPENVRQWAPYAISGLGSLVAAKTMGADNGTALGAALAGGYAGGRLYNGQPLIPQGVKDWGADQWRHATQTQENASGRPNIGTEKTISDNAANAAAQSQNAANAAAQAQ